MGLFFIFDAGYARSIQKGWGDIPPEFMGQLKYVGFAVAAWIMGSSVKAEKWSRYSKIVWIVSLLGLVAVKVVGSTMNGARRWVDLGPFNIQPSEFVKIAAILYLAGVFADRKPWPEKMPRCKDWAHWLDKVAIPKLVRCLPAIWVLVAVGLIEKEPDLGTGAVVAATAFCMFCLGGASKKTLLVGAVLGLMGCAFLVKQEPYRMERILSHTSRWDAKNVDDQSYQTVQSELAMATGGLIGVGPGAGRAKHVLPAPTTDFIMTTVAEEFGLVGALTVLSVLCALVLRLLMLAQRTTAPFQRLVLAGTACWLGIQTCVNMMMANGFAPAIGIPVPFLSSGGSSLVALWLALGICNSVLAPVPAKEVANASSRNGWRDRRTHLSRA
jgi:cell division protein FtsW (lipid II flippase)